MLVYPHHLGDGKLYGAQENDFYYFLGCAYEMKGDTGKARECREQATLGPQEPAAAMYHDAAKRYLDEASELDINHLGILSFKTLMEMFS